MTILIRVDAYPEIGLGHFVRSFDIAVNLKRTGHCEVVFAGIYNEKALEKLDKEGFSSIQQKKTEQERDFLFNAIKIWNPALVFIDNLFNYTEELVKILKEKTKILLFHNLCDGRFFADAFILPSAHHPDEVINDGRWESNPVEFYHGYDYILLNEKVKSVSPRKKTNEEKPVISITTGGSDPKGVMLKILEWVNIPEFEEVRFRAMPGEAFMKKKELEIIKPLLRGNISLEEFNYQTLASSDLVISTFGVTSYELLYLGIPFVSISHSENNARGSHILSKKLPLIKDLGLIDHLTGNVFKESLHKLLGKKDLYEDFRIMSTDLMDAKGMDRIVDIILRLTEKS